MKSIMIIGVGPLPSPEAERVHAPGLRLEAFVDAAVSQKLKVYLGELEFSGESLRKFKPRRDVEAHRLLEGPMPQVHANLEYWLREIEPDALVALTDVGALAAVRSGYDGPLYVDYNGHPMSERQQQAFVYQNNESLADQWLHVLPALLRADRFCVCSQAQRLALLGELGAAGRLNAETAGYEFVDVIPPSLPFQEPLKLNNPAILEKYDIPSDARLILSTGGFNTWIDEETLFQAIEAVLRQERNTHFVVTGGSIEGHVNIVFERFLERAEASPFRDRFHFLGWVPHNDLLDLMQEAHVAVNCDLPVLEGELGFRNRLLGWLWAGLRVVSTVTSNPAWDLAAKGLITPVPCRDWHGLAKALAEETQKGRQENPEHVRQELLQGWGRDEKLRPLLEWLNDPRPAPDRAPGASVNPLTALQKQFLHLAEEQKMELYIRRRAREASQRLLGSRMISTYCRMNPEVKRILEELSHF